MSLEKFNVILAPTREMAELIDANATVEAEYGDYCVEGKEITLAHHGSRSSNPAPCNSDVQPLEGGTILVSHLDLDAIGGVLAVTGDKIENSEFWEAAEFIDVNGVHHIHELPQDIQDKLNAVYAWNDTQPRVRYTEITDVTENVQKNMEMLEKVLDERHPEHENMINAGKEWEEATTSAVEARLMDETEYVRVFSTNGPFCSASYYSPNLEAVVPCTVSFNEKFNSITVAFADGGRESGGSLSAREIVQKLWGPEASGRDGIAGSPRGQVMTKDNLVNCAKYVEAMVQAAEICQQMDVEKIADLIQERNELRDELTQNEYEKNEAPINEAESDEESLSSE